jgi:hypothetical protein
MNRNLATILAALRCWQQALAVNGPNFADQFEQFELLRPLTVAENDALCEELNAPDDSSDLCDCEAAGFFCAGVPGILAHLEEGRVAPGAKVERCDMCQRLPSDEAALAKLQELGIA